MITTLGNLGKCDNLQLLLYPISFHWLVSLTLLRENLTSEQLQQEACEVREMVVREAADISKFTVMTLKAVLAHNGKEYVDISKSWCNACCETLTEYFICAFWCS